jgi:uroporphyrinogen decarboxylase
VLQIFDTWAGALPPVEFEAWVVAPTRRIVSEVRARHPKVPIIGFPRGAGGKIERYIVETGVQGVGCDTGMEAEHMRILAKSMGAVVQGNLDPLALVAGGEALERQTVGLLKELAGVPYIFNLGHGIVPETPPEHVERLVALVRGAH